MVEEDDDEVDVVARPVLLELGLQPLGLGAAGDAQVGRDLEGDVVGVQRDDRRVAVDEGVDARQVLLVRSVVRQGPARFLAAVAVGRVPGLHVVVAVGRHPGDLLGDGLRLEQELVPHARVEAGVVLPALARRVAVGDVAGVQVEGRVLAEEQAVVGQRVVADALVAERREGERLGLRGGGGEGAEGAQQMALGRVEARVADPVVVGLAGTQVGELGVQVVLRVVAAGTDTRRGVQGADLRRDLAGQVPGVGTDPDEGVLDGDRDLPGDRDLGARVVAEGQVAPEGGDQSAVDGLGRRGRALGRDGRLGGGARTNAPPATAPRVTAPPLIIVRRENLARRYSCCSAMLMSAASFSGTPIRGMSMWPELPPHEQRDAGRRMDSGQTRTHKSFNCTCPKPGMILAIPAPVPQDLPGARRTC